MKKLFIFPILLMAGSLAAQETSSSSYTTTEVATNDNYGYLYSKGSSAPIRIGVRGGFSMARFSHSGDVNGTSSINTGDATLYAEVPLHRYFYVQGGVSYVRAGGTYSVKGGEAVNYTLITATPNYVQIPVTAVGKLAIGKKANAFLGAGGYFGLAVGGKASTMTEMTDGRVFRQKSDINFGSDAGVATFGDPGNMKKTDAGLQGMVGLEFNNVTLSGHISQGLMNVRSAENSTLKNQVISINFGLLF